MAEIKFPHNFRINYRTFLFFLRTFIAIAVLLCFILVTEVENRSKNVLGQKSYQNTEDDNFEMAVRKADDYYKFGSSSDLSEAINFLNTTLKANINNPYSLKLLGTLDQQRNITLTKEIEDVNTVLKERPDYPAAWLKLSILYNNDGELEMAKLALERAENLSLGF